MKINSIHFFRGIAILFIIAGHFVTNISMGKGIKLEELPMIYKILNNFVYGGTGYFVFISGFLFYSVFYKKFEYKKFIIKKIENVFIPFCILSIYPIVNMFFIDKNYSGYGADYNIISALKVLFLGNHMTGYWYICFVMILFLLSPLYIQFIKKDNKELFLVIAIIIAFFVKRPPQNSNQLQSLIFFTPFYMLGIYCAINKEKIISFFSNKKLILFILVILIEVVNINFFENIKFYDKFIIQKLICCILILVILTKFENKKMFILDKLAEYSFAIYFLHAYMLRVFENKIIPNMKNENFFILFSLEMVSVLSVCIIVAIIVKKILGKYSRYIIGY